MEISILNSQDKIPIEEELLNLIKRVIAECLAAAGVPGENVEVSVMLTDDRGIQELNACYRGIDEPTDVLSFALEEGEEPLGGDGPAGMDDIRLLGDIVVSVETAARQAAEVGHGFCQEVGWLVAHGTLHLLGYDHQDEQGYEFMRSIEEKATARAYLGIGTEIDSTLRNL